MPSKGEVSKYTGVFRLTSPSDPNRRVIKRNRQVVSCVPCRNRKLKCDRQQPCASCVRRHDEDACRFHAGSGERDGSEKTKGHPSASALPKREMQTKLAMLENLVQGFMSQTQPKETSTSEVQSRETSHSAASSPGGSAGGTEQIPMGGDHVRRDDNEVRFMGATNYQAVLECIRELQGCVENTERPAPVGEASPQQRGQVEAKDRPFAPQSSITIQDVMKELPSRAECDALLTFYFQQTYMVPVCIHTGQFQRAYERFWQMPEETSLLWISLLFSVLSTSVFTQASKTLGDDEVSNALTADSGKKIASFSSMAYRCLLVGDYLAGKPYSVEATLIFGMHLVLQKKDTDPICWHTIGTAVRIAQKMGYHRDASHLVRNGSDSTISPFEGEMRRRVWAYLEYFDVVHSFQHGIPPMIHGDMVDTRLPTNLRDDEFSEDVSALPHARSTLEFTPILVTIFGARQIKLLRRVIQQALAVETPSYGDVRLLDSELRSLHEDVPPSLRYRPVRESGFADVPDVIMRRMLCEILYLKCMCVLHRRYLTFEGAMYEGSHLACREASIRLLDLQAEFDEHSGEGGRLYEKRYMFTNPTGYHDFLLAAMCICLDLINGSHQRDPRDHERIMNALRRARIIWSKTAHRSKEAAHAAGILEDILSKIDQPDKDPVSARPLPTDARGHLATPPDSDPARIGENTPGSVRTGEALLSKPNGPAANTGAAPEKAPSKSYSVEWDYEWLDNLGMQKRKDRDLSNALDHALIDGVDWNRIDSLLLGREHTTGTRAMSAPGQGDKPGTTREAPREGWPMMRYGPERTDAHSSANFGSWARTGCSLAGFGPSSSGPHFL